MILIRGDFGRQMHGDKKCPFNTSPVMAELGEKVPEIEDCSVCELLQDPCSIFSARQSTGLLQTWTVAIYVGPWHQYCFRLGQWLSI